VNEKEGVSVLDQPTVQDRFVTERFVDASDASTFLSISRKTLLTLARAGRIPAHPIGNGVRKIWRFRVSELARWMQGGVNSSQRLGPLSREEKVA
jgi:Helix-turn-helix domain